MIDHLEKRTTQTAGLKREQESAGKPKPTENQTLARVPGSAQLAQPGDRQGQRGKCSSVTSWHLQDTCPVRAPALLV